MTIKQIDEAYDFGCGEAGCAFVEGYAPRLNFYKQALIALRKERERAENKPLTLEQLKERDGKPVWIDKVGKGSPLDEYYEHGYSGGWGIVAFVGYSFMRYCQTDHRETTKAFCDYGKIWLAYDHEPERSET